MRKPIKFEVHYHGTPVLVGEKYDPKNLHAHLMYSDKEFVDVRSVDYEVNDNLITHTGQNTFKATYSWNGIKFIDYFMVYGYTNKEYINKEFKIYSIYSNPSFEEDLTDTYSSLFYDVKLGKMYITVGTLNRHLPKGTYRLIAPKGSGLHHRYATEWIVNKNNDNVNVTLVKVYNEEV